MATVLKFVETFKDKTFAELQLFEADIVVGSLFSYASFEKTKEYEKHSLSNHTCRASVFNKPKILNQMSENYLNPKDFKKFLEPILSFRRYKNLQIGYIKNFFSEKRTMQFFTFTIFTKNYNVIFFRGTDISFLGWEENFNMILEDRIPSQVAAKKYVKEISQLNTRPIIIAGHSKGGNLAVYSSIFLNPKKVQSVYTFDSPGFNKSFLNEEGFKHIKDKIIAFAPQTSIIGRILYQDYKITIVDSEKALFNQHNLYNWNIEAVQFKKLDKFTYLSNKINDVVKHNLEKLSYDEKVEFVESLFGILKEMSKDDVIQFEDNLWSFFLRFNKILKTKSEETKKLIYSIFKKDKNSEPIKRIEPLKNKDSKIKKFFNLFKKEKRDTPDIIENEIDN